MMLYQVPDIVNVSVLTVSVIPVSDAAMFVEPLYCREPTISTAFIKTMCSPDYN